jgi:hypothetical protein
MATKKKGESRKEEKKEMKMPMKAYMAKEKKEGKSSTSPKFKKGGCK